MIINFTLNEQEQDSLYIWEKEHSKKCQPNRETTYPITFTPTSIGVKIEVKCSKCSEIKDLTDYSSW